MAVIKLSKGDNSSSSTVDEFSSHSDIQESDLDSSDLIVEELSGDSRTRIRERDSDEHYVKVDPNSEYVQKYFDESEISELSQKHEIVNGEPTETPDIDSVWEGVKSDIEERNKQVAREKMEQEIEQARERMKEHTKYGTPVNELQGSEFQELIQEANGDGSPEPEGFAEVEKQIREKYEPMLEDSEPEINSTEELSDGIDAFREYDNPVFEELADDLEKSDSQTMYESVGPDTKRVTTTDSEMKEALRNHESEPVDYDVELEQDTGETVVAVVSKD